MTSSNAVRRAVRYALLVSAVTASAAVVTPASAQNSPTVLEKVVVTGSRISRQDAETAGPLEVLSREDIEKSGQQSISDVIRQIAADNQGSIPTSFTNGFASGAAAVSLRGLGVNSTLVLINGRRSAPYGLADDGSRTFVDLNSIPFEAVERVEVLKDGASALYGSDAIAGVVNIILRKTYEGAALSADYGSSYADDGTTTHLTGTYGFGNLDSDNYNVFFTAEWSHQQEIAQRDRPEYLGTSDLTRFKFFDNRQGAPSAGRGNFVNPATGLVLGPAFSAVTPYGSVRLPGGTTYQRINLTPCPEISQSTGVCLFDMIDYYQIQPEVERTNLYSRGNFKFSDTVSAYAELGFFQSDVTYIGTPGGVNDNGVFNPGDPLNPVTAPHTTFLPLGHPDNPTTSATRVLSLLTTDLGGRSGKQESDVLRVVAGMEAELFSDWKLEAGIAHIRSELESTRTGYVRHPALVAALANGSYRINQPNLVSAATRAAISPELKNTSTSSVSIVDANVSGNVLELPAGSIGISVGAEWRKETADSPPTPYTDTGEIVGLGYSAFESDRTIYAGYFEVLVPVVKMLELEAAFRYDHYSDYGSSSTPKLGFKFTPIDQIALRGTYSEGFRAPGPTESGKSSSLGFTNIAIITIGDASVKPETSKMYTLGLVLEPVKGTSATIDYYKIDRTNEITQADQAVIVAGRPTTGQTAFSRVPGGAPNSFLYYDDVGDLATISGPYANANKTTTSGLDLDLRQSFSLSSYGELQTSLKWTHIISFEKELTGGQTFEYAGTHGPYVLSSAGGTPRNRGSFETTWSLNDWSLTARLNYVSGMQLIDHDHEELVDNGDGTWSTLTSEGAYFVADPVNGGVCGVYSTDGRPYNNCRVASFTTLDLSGKLTVGENAELTGSVLNVTNKLAPFDPYTYGGHNYNPAFNQSGAVGRFMTLGLRVKF